MKHRIAFVVHQYPVISQAFILNAAASLVEAGCSVDFIAVNGRASDLTQTHPIQAEIDRSTRFLAPRHLQSRLDRFLEAPKTIQSVAQAYGWRAVRSFDPILFKKRAFNLRTLYDAEALAANNTYDIIHCHFATLAPFALSMRRAGFLKGRVVVHFRGYDISKAVKEQGPDIYGKVFKEADWFLAVCRLFRDRAITLGCDPSRIDVIPSATNIDTFAFAPRVWPKDGKIRLLGVGRLVEKKGFNVAIEAVRILRQRGRSVELRIVGEGPQRPMLESAIRAGSLSDVVELVGAKSHKDLAEEFHQAHIFLAPSLTARDGDQDGVVNTLKEAMASGAPVVATQHGGIPELVDHEVSGFLAPEGDAELFAACIDQLIDRSESWPAMGAAGRSKVYREYSLEVANRKLLNSYQSVLAAEREIPFESFSNFGLFKGRR